MRRLGALAGAALAALSLSFLGGCADGDEGAVTVVVTLPRTPVPFAKGNVLVDYTRSGASILREGAAPACAFILPGLSGDFTDDGRGVLSIRVGNKRGLQGPSDIVACRLKPGDPTVTAEELAADLSIKIAEATDAAGKPVDLTAKPSKPRAAEAGPGGEGGGGADAEGDDSTPASRMSDAAKEAAKQAAKDAAEKKQAEGQGAAKDAANSGKDDGTAGSPSAQPPGARPQPVAPSRQPAGSNAGSQNTGGALPNAGVPSGTAPTAAENPPVTPNYNSDPNYDDSVGGDSTAPEYDVVITVGATRSLGALQVEVLHLGSSGSWVGRGADVDCEQVVDAMPAANFVGGRGVKIGLISLQGIPTPGDVVVCGFRSRERVTPASFQVRIVDAADTDSQPLTPIPNVVVSSVTRR